MSIAGLRGRAGRVGRRIPLNRRKKVHGVAFALQRARRPLPQGTKTTAVHLHLRPTPNSPPFRRQRAICANRVFTLVFSIASSFAQRAPLVPYAEVAAYAAIDFCGDRRDRLSGFAVLGQRTSCPLHGEDIACSATGETPVAPGNDDHRCTPTPSTYISPPNSPPFRRQRAICANRVFTLVFSTVPSEPQRTPLAPLRRGGAAVRPPLERHTRVLHKIV